MPSKACPVNLMAMAKKLFVINFVHCLDYMNL